MTENLHAFSRWLDRHLNFERTPQKNIFWLDTMRFLCTALHEPQDACPAFHVAGSKGKGSISVMLASILQAAGERAGLYTSPHILELTERAGFPDRPFDDSVYEQSAGELMRTVDALSPEAFPAGRPVTWFELVTLFGMLCFRNAGCTWAVYEVGLGGRLDSTNVITPACCCLGSIELEHTEYLGNTIAAIAREKGGIIKEGIPVVCAAQSAEAQAVFTRIAEEKSAPLIFADKAVQVSGLRYREDAQTGAVRMELTMESPFFSRPLRPVLRLTGEFQAHNAAVAAMAAKTVLPRLDESVIEQGLSAAFLPGRFEIVPKAPGGNGPLPLLVLDGAHTRNSISFTMQEFLQLYGSHGSRHLLYASAADKDVEHIAACFAGAFDAVTLTRPGEAKATDLPRVERAFGALGIAHCTEPDFRDAILRALQAAAEADAVLLITGSFYLVAEAKRVLASFTALTP